VRPARVAFSGALLTLLTTQALADYRIDWHAVNGGGGTSSAPGVSVSGTIAQPSPGYSDGGNYQLVAGFWVAAPLVSDVIFRNGFQGEQP
jgi:hypothetical protein